MLGHQSVDHLKSKVFQGDQLPKWSKYWIMKFHCSLVNFFNKEKFEEKYNAFYAFSFSFKRRKSERQRKSNCKAELEGIKLEFAEDDKDLVLLPAMEGDALKEVFPDLDGEWGVNPNKKTILSTRINQFPDEYVY